jgi:probable HAF family extracellular repeat protein
VDQADRHGHYGAFPGAIATVPGCCHTINDSGEIVGFAISANGDTRALIWQGREPKDLNDFVRAPSPFMQLLGAFSISDAGDFVGIGLIETGEVRAFSSDPAQQRSPQ